tara:strand:- start:57 stop:212 length:156 start_codon:yes stop_codon:yes gene_type:complete
MVPIGELAVAVGEAIVNDDSFMEEVDEPKSRIVYYAVCFSLLVGIYMWKVY